MTSRIKAISGLLGLFAVGAALGATGVGLYVRHQVREAQSLRSNEGFHQYFVDKLELTDSQHDSLRAELESAYRELSDLRSRNAEKYNDLLDSLSAHLAPKLTAHQRELLKEEEMKFRQNIPREKSRSLAIPKQDPSVQNIPSTALPLQNMKQVLKADSVQVKLEPQKTSTIKENAENVVPPPVQAPVRKDSATPPPISPDEQNSGDSGLSEDDIAEFKTIRHHLLAGPFRGLFRECNTRLDLNIRQRVQIRRMIVASAKSTLQEFDAAQGNRPAQREVFKAAMERLQGSILQVLTADQQPKFRQIQTEMLDRLNRKARLLGN